MIHILKYVKIVLNGIEIKKRMKILIKNNMMITSIIKNNNLIILFIKKVINMIFIK